MYNPVFNFQYKINEELYNMHFTSVTGHLMNFEFVHGHEKWILEDIKDLYNTEIEKRVSTGNSNIVKNLDHLGKKADVLILWLDCDREGENIAYEVIDVVKKANPNIKILRAKFSALTETDIQESISNLVEPDKNVSDAVELRSRIDLLIGSTFTRLQTLAFRNILPIYSQKKEKDKNDLNAKKVSVGKGVISYGPCQFPTLNFVVERHDKIENFVPEEYYTIDLKILKDNTEVKFNWKRERLFDKKITKIILEKILEEKKLKVTNVESNPKIKYRPIPLNTVEMTKLISRKLKIPSHIAMDVAEKLYQKGYISYPRTETQKYRHSEVFILKRVLENLGKGTGYSWCKYASELKFNRPRDGKLDDKSHPPIHPVKFVDFKDLTDYEIKVYDLLVLHFLATLSTDAKGDETLVEIKAGEEEFFIKGVNIKEKGFLEIYPYDNWSETFIPNFEKNEEFPTKDMKFTLNHGKTTPPFHLSEAELISLMDKFGIGTDATIHEHIKNIQERGYAQQFKSLIRPSQAGIALVKAYQKIGVELYKPYLRAKMEKDMKDVSEGNKNYQLAYNQMKEEMEKIFDKVNQNIPVMKKFIREYLNIVENEENVNENSKKNLNVKCPNCNENKLRLMNNKVLKNYFIGCSGFPTCKTSISIKNPIIINEIDEVCKECNNKLFELEFKNNKEKEIKCISGCLFKENYVIEVGKNDQKNYVANRLEKDKKNNKDIVVKNKNKKNIDENEKINKIKKSKDDSKEVLKPTKKFSKLNKGEKTGGNFLI